MNKFNLYAILLAAVLHCSYAPQSAGTWQTPSGGGSLIDAFPGSLGGAVEAMVKSYEGQGYVMKLVVDAEGNKHLSAVWSNMNTNGPNAGQIAPNPPVPASRSDFATVPQGEWLTTEESSVLDLYPGASRLDDEIKQKIKAHEERGYKVRIRGSGGTTRFAYTDVPTIKSIISPEGKASGIIQGSKMGTPDGEWVSQMGKSAIELYPGSLPSSVKNKIKAHEKLGYKVKINGRGLYTKVAYLGERIGT